ncbi:phosphotransferase [Streptomyces triculaminicus]|uniref:Phosphotransferase n=1 Tax=Streptomyces triculaminicus TaxID=2816232 RepID=A0A939FW92_9ACTN|nr:phosphotransferase [Streptomyces triculaminicus]MBO0657235.1 phosphotransferase [Streptomyces triculaminicus]
MDTTDVTALLPRLLADAGLEPSHTRTPIRVWARSGVERLTFPDGASAVFKYAEEPFDGEDYALGVAAAAGLPVPALYAAQHRGPLLGMLIEDLGASVRDADDLDGATAAAAIHRVSNDPGLRMLDEAALATLPTRLCERLERHEAAEELRRAADALYRAAETRAQGAQLPPFGLVHSEFHPTSVHIGAGELRILDLARAFIGPGLIDLASWHGTLDAPDPDRTSALLERYVEAGGAREALDVRGGLDAASWALGWHRIWAAEWFTEQLDRGWAKGAEDKWMTAIRRHVGEAVALLKP